MEVSDIKPLDNGTKVATAIKYMVALPYALAPLAYWGVSVYMGVPVDMLIWILVLTGYIVSLYLIFGQKQVDAAVDQAQDIAGRGGSEDKSE